MELVLKNAQLILLKTISIKDVINAMKKMQIKAIFTMKMANVWKIAGNFIIKIILKIYALIVQKKILIFFSKIIFALKAVTNIMP
jgi:hypothetical protein